MKYGVNVNRSFFIPMANQRYDSWQTNLTKRFSQGLFLTSSFTWSKAIGINAGNSDSGLRFYVPSQFSKNKSVADFDRTAFLGVGGELGSAVRQEQEVRDAGPGRG